MIIDKSTAIKSLAPLSEFSISKDLITWLSTEIAQPTEAEIAAEVARLQAEYDNSEYQRQRAAAYPSLPAQLDQIYHEGVDAWKATIAAVKMQYPKPE